MNGRSTRLWQSSDTPPATPRQQQRCRRSHWLGVGCSALAVLSSGVWQPTLLAAPPESAPANTTPAAAVPSEVSDLFRRLDAAASRQDLNATLKFYSPNFTHGDGLNLKMQQQALKQFWQTAKSLQYQTQVNSWKADSANRYTVETTTILRGTRTLAEQEMALTTTVRSRLTIADQKILTQDVLSEQTRLTAGTRPPEVQINLPEQVTVGQSFNFEAVVKEPLGDELLLGSALEESITPERYLNPSPIAFVYPPNPAETQTAYLLCSKPINEPPSSLCSAGGLFKVGQAPPQPTRKWLSALFVKSGGGMTIVSQRLNVVRPSGSASPASP